MTPAIRDERRRAFRIDPDVWRDPSFDWACEDLIDVTREAAASDSPAEFIPVAVQRLIPAGHVRSWAIITIDDRGGLHRDGESAADPGLFSRAVSWLWTAMAEPCASDSGAAYVEAWHSTHRAEGIACLPLVRDASVKGVIAVWLTADDMDAIVCDASRLTVVVHLWAGIQERHRDRGADAVSRGENVPHVLTVR